MTRRIAAIGVAFVIGLAVDVSPAAAQSASSPGGLEIAVGPLWTARTPLTSGDANETTATGDALRLFTTSTTLAPAFAAEVQVGVYVADHLEVFAAGSFGTRQLRIVATDDLENAAPVTVAERLQQYTLTGGIRWALSTSRLAPFLSAEGGILRELHEEQTLVESGRIFLVGGGVNIRFSGRRSGRLGVRVDARAIRRSKGFLLETKRVVPAAGVSLFARF